MADKDTEKIDISEKGRSSGGQVISSDQRLFMQLLVYGGCSDSKILTPSLGESGIECVLYEELNDPQGIGLLTVSSDPNDFLLNRKLLLNKSPFTELQQKPEYTMLGRTYALGYEADLEEALLRRPRRRIHNGRFPWAIWYPLRRSGSFERLSAKEQRIILQEHGGIGRSFGRAGYGYDVRLACHGLDKNDNDFVIGLLGPDLFPLSAIVQRMRKTKQTSMYLEQLGPFFIGKAVFHSESDKNDE